MGSANINWGFKADKNFKCPYAAICVGKSNIMGRVR